MKRRRLDSDEDEDEFISAAAAASAPLLPYASTVTGGLTEDMLLEMGIAPSPSASTTSSVANRRSRGSSRSSSVSAERGPTRAQDGNPPVDLLQHRQQEKPSSKEGEEDSHGLDALASRQPDDLDVPPHWYGLLSDALLTAYAVPLLYMEAQRPLDDKLLAQYLPFDETGVRPLRNGGSGGGAAALDDVEDLTAVQQFRIGPGWRWDGVVRGRQKVLAPPREFSP